MPIKRRVIAYNRKTKSNLYDFESVSEAAREFKTSQCRIIDYCKKRRLRRGNVSFKYADKSF